MSGRLEIEREVLEMFFTNLELQFSLMADAAEYRSTDMLHKAVTQFLAAREAWEEQRRRVCTAESEELDD